jgi:thiosulfate/3-mercaptopyruvate sulfurtransferase
MMKHISCLPALLVLISLASGFQAAAQKKAEPDVSTSLIVSTDWVAQHLKDHSLVLLQVGEKTEYTAAHIPGAQFIALADISTPRGQGLTLELPPVEQLKTTFEKLGVSNKSRVVIYFSKDWVTPTARVFMTLDYLGLGDRTSILDGGLPAWQAEGRATTTGVSTPTLGKLTPHPKQQLVVDTAWVNANLSMPGVMIVDARAGTFHIGEEVGRSRGGQIPGARNIPFASVVKDSNRLQSVETLR